MVSWQAFFQILVFWVLASFTIIIVASVRRKTRSTMETFNNVVLIEDSVKTYHDENTLAKVYQALDGAGFDMIESVNATGAILNSGILFRERVETPDNTSLRVKADIL